VDVGRARRGRPAHSHGGRAHSLATTAAARATASRVGRTNNAAFYVVPPAAGSTALRVASP
jgi:hypothetical protein